MLRLANRHSKSNVSILPKIESYYFPRKYYAISQSFKSDQWNLLPYVCEITIIARRYMTFGLRLTVAVLQHETISGYILVELNTLNKFFRHKLFSLLWLGVLRSECSNRGKGWGCNIFKQVAQRATIAHLTTSKYF